MKKTTTNNSQANKYKANFSDGKSVGLLSPFDSVIFTTLIKKEEEKSKITRTLLSSKNGPKKDYFSLFLLTGRRKTDLHGCAASR